MCVVTAHETGLARELKLVPVESFSPVVEHEGLARDNPLGRIPALVTDHGHALYDSRVICEYLCHRAGNKTLLPNEPVKRFRIMTIVALGQGMCDSAVNLRYETVQRPESKRWPELIERQRKRLMRSTDDLERLWMTDLGEVTAASISIAVALGYLDFRHSNIDWRKGHPILGQWFAKFSQRASMEASEPTSL